MIHACFLEPCTCSNVFHYKEQSDKTDEGFDFPPHSSFFQLVGTTILMSEDKRGMKIGT